MDHPLVSFRHGKPQGGGQAAAVLIHVSGQAFLGMWGTSIRQARHEA